MPSPTARSRFSRRRHGGPDLDWESIRVEEEREAECQLERLIPTLERTDENAGSGGAEPAIPDVEIADRHSEVVELRGPS